MAFDLATNLTPIIQGVVDIMPVFLDLETCKSDIGFTSGIHCNGTGRNHSGRRIVPSGLLRQDPLNDKILGMFNIPGYRNSLKVPVD